MMRTAQMKRSMIKDWGEVLFCVLFRYLATATSLLYWTSSDLNVFELHPREEEHHAEEDNAHGAR